MSETLVEASCGRCRHAKPVEGSELFKLGVVKTLLARRIEEVRLCGRNGMYLRATCRTCGGFEEAPI